MTKEEKLKADYITRFLKSVEIGIDPEGIKTVTSDQYHFVLSDYMADNYITADLGDMYFEEGVYLYLNKNNFLADDYNSNFVDFIALKLTYDLRDTALIERGKRWLRIRYNMDQFPPMDFLVFQYEETERLFFFFDYRQSYKVLEDIESKVNNPTDFSACSALFWCIDKMKWTRDEEKNEEKGVFSGDLSKEMSKDIASWLRSYCFQKFDYGVSIDIYLHFDFSIVLVYNQHGRTIDYIERIVLMRKSYLDRALPNYEPEDNSSHYESSYNYNKDWSNDDMWDHIQAD